MIKIKNLSTSYDGEAVLHGVDAHFPEGKISVLIGPNGCGKSTTVKSIMRLVPEYTGEIIIGGTPLEDIPQRELAKKIASKADEIDTVISELSTKRSVDRIAKINLAILRLAIYEAKFEDSVPVNVAISEAVLLARKYAKDPDVKFINGVLGAFSRSDKEEDNA